MNPVVGFFQQLGRLLGLGGSGPVPTPSPSLSRPAPVPSPSCGSPTPGSRRELEAAGHKFRTKEEIDAELEEMRKEWND